MKINLHDLSIAELNELRHDIAVEIESRAKGERQKLVQEFRDKAKALGTSLEELLAGPKGRGRPAGKVAAKYAHPGDAKLTWTGRGKRPHWVTDWLNSGRSLDELKV
jgi:DNA-binding protein H-NS